jgi:flagellar motor switch protein FliM
MKDNSHSTDYSASAAEAVPFDFRRPDRIPQGQLSVIQFVHEGFLRIVTSSLSLYLRADVSGEVRGVEQMAYGDLADGLPSPTCLVYLAMQPQEGTTVVEVNQSLVSPILDCVLGGNGKISTQLDREITEIEQDMLGGFFRILAHDLTEAWKHVTPMTFSFDGVETKPQLSKRIGRNEAVIAIALELRVGETAGMVTVTMPSISLKMLREASEQQSAARKSGSEETQAAIRQRLAEGLKLEIECALLGSTIRMNDLLQLKPGDLIDSGIACDGSATLLVNGIPKFHGEIIVQGSRHAIVIH